ncbi:MAG: TIGR03790 family protein, partial [Thermodesulfobacteriota bacterium]
MNEKFKHRDGGFAPVFWLWLLLWWFPATASGLEPSEILVVANENQKAGLQLAEAYCRRRNIPMDQLIRVRTTDVEVCPRQEYDTRIAGPVRRYLDRVFPPWRIRCIVLMYGIPLKIEPSKADPAEAEALDRLVRQKLALEGEIQSRAAFQAEETHTLRNQLKGLEADIRAARLRNDRWASVDSEIALVSAGPYELGGWIPNPFYLGNAKQTLSIDKDRVLMVSRLDGPTPETVKRIIDDAIQTEQKGLTGTACFDARWPEPEGEKPLGGYAFYDRSIHRAARLLKQHPPAGISVVLNAESDLFGPGECRETALYCGWYSLGKYVDSFSWKPGAVGYHIASSECATLKKKGSQVWCKRMLEEGVAATIGPISEPYVQAFPVPEIFFRFLAQGRLSLAECYLIALPYLSWKMVLIGDPL